jgi:hypothetical protein
MGEISTADMLAKEAHAINGVELPAARILARLAPNEWGK